MKDHQLPVTNPPRLVPTPAAPTPLLVLTPSASAPILVSTPVAPTHAPPLVSTSTPDASTPSIAPTPAAPTPCLASTPAAPPPLFAPNPSALASLLAPTPTVTTVPPPLASSYPITNGTGIYERVFNPAGVMVADRFMMAPPLQPPTTQQVAVPQAPPIQLPVAPQQPRVGRSAAVSGIRGRNQARSTRYTQRRMYQNRAAPRRQGPDAGQHVAITVEVITVSSDDEEATGAESEEVPQNEVAVRPGEGSDSGTARQETPAETISGASNEGADSGEEDAQEEVDQTRYTTKFNRQDKCQIS